MKIVIIGGVAGGATAAARIRRLDERAEIVMLERSGYISYANCGLPYYVGGVIADAGELTLQTPESFRRRFHIDVRVRHEAFSVDRAAHTVAVRNLETGETYAEFYDRLLLAPGAEPIRPALPGIDLPGVFTLRTVEDTLRISHALEEQRLRSAVIVGGGFIGVEMAENLHRRGLAVTILEKQPQLLGQLDADMACFVHAHLREKGISLALGQGLAGIEAADGGRLTVRTEAGAALPADAVLLALGVRPESRLAAEAGLALGVKNSIAVNDRMQTSDPDVYAVGDAVQVTHTVTGAPALVSLAGPANRQARIAADNICGRESRYRGVCGTSVLQVFDLTVASTGVGERQARAAELDYDRVVLSPLSHAGYYPGGKVMTVKLLFARGDARILGAQIVGGDGVDKRIDVLATAMQAGLPVTALGELELAYAPPFSSAKDPVNMAGYIAENLLTGVVRQIGYDDLAALPRDGSVTLLDTRTDAEYAAGHADGFDTHIPVDALRGRLGELDPAKPVYVMCQSGLRSYIACRILSQSGFTCYNFSGGYRFYRTVHEERAGSAEAFPCGMEKTR